MIPYINIHTHHLSKDDGVFLFNNRFGSDQSMFLEKYFSVGIHPWDAALNISTSELEKIITNQNCLAIGECGMDKSVDIDFDIQKTVFKAQLDLGIKFQKPVIIHCVKAFDEVMEICKPYLPHISLIIHGFNKSHQLANQLIKCGFHLSLNSSIFLKNEFDFDTISLANLFLETDDRNSLSIKNVYESAAVRLKIDENQLREKIYVNFKTLFK